MAFSIGKDTVPSGQFFSLFATSSGIDFVETDGYFAAASGQLAALPQASFTAYYGQKLTGAERDECGDFYGVTVEYDYQDTWLVNLSFQDYFDAEISSPSSVATASVAYQQQQLWLSAEVSHSLEDDPTVWNVEAAWRLNPELAIISRIAGNNDLAEAPKEHYGLGLHYGLSKHFIANIEGLHGRVAGRSIEQLNLRLQVLF